MKGIVHFLSGLAAATFFPEAVNLAAAQSSFILVLGGIGGLLPDTLDFRLSRFLEKPDVDIDPHPANPDPQDIAERVAEAINRVAGNHRKVVMQLRTMRLGPDLWRRYTLRFDVENRNVIVKLGPVVNTSQMPQPEGTGRKEDAPRDPPSGSVTRGNGDAATRVNPDAATQGHGETEMVGDVVTGVALLSQLSEGRASVDAPIHPTYGEETNIDIFGGPSFALEWRQGLVEIDFIPWHRQWSHSLTFAALFGVIAGLVFGPTAGAITALAYTVHIAQDQLGFLGSNLLYPFTRRRTAGLKWIHSGEAVPNFLTVWLMLVIILFNLDRFSARPQIDPPIYLGLAFLPPLVLLVAYLVFRRRTGSRREKPRRGLEQSDLAQEMQEPVDA